MKINVNTYIRTHPIENEYTFVKSIMNESDHIVGIIVDLIIYEDYKCLPICYQINTYEKSIALKPYQNHLKRIMPYSLDPYNVKLLNNHYLNQFYCKLKEGDWIPNG